jgi:hypothetical protein
MNAGWPELVLALAVRGAGTAAATPQPVTAYAGSREIVSSGRAAEADLPEGRYAVTQHYSVARRSARDASLHGRVVYRDPGDGLALYEETIDEHDDLARDGGVSLLSLHRVTHGTDVSGPPQSFTVVRTEETAFPGGERILPASLAPHRETLSLASTVRHTASDTGPPGTTYAQSDVRRVTAADGSFEETGSIGIANAHRVRQVADGSGSASDIVAGFSLYDATIAAPEGSGPDARIAVTVRTQGRAIGDAPVTTQRYDVPLWYAAAWPAPLAEAVLSVEAPRAADSRCRPAAGRVVPVIVERKRVEVSGRIIDERDERDFDRSRRMLCRLTSTTTRRYDITTGSLLGTTVDTTIVHAEATARRMPRRAERRASRSLSV